MSTRSGPQTYPGASTAYWYQDDYPGSAMDVNVVVLHTTEGRTVPSYGGGALAPNLTAVPDVAARRLRWYQHFDIDVSSRALRNLAGGVQTNTLNVVQVELVGTCDPATHRRWGTAPHVFWPQAPDWALRDLAAFLKWLNANHGVPLTAPARWPAYPTSYGTSGGQRMTASQWTAFKGVCGHMHVPENDHGDPGSLDITTLLAYARSGTPEEDPMAGITKQDIFDAVWKTDQIAAPVDAPDYATNRTWQPQSLLKDIDTRVRALQGVEAGQSAAIAALAGLVGSGVDTAAVVAAVQDAIRDAVVKVDVAVTGADAS